MRYFELINENERNLGDFEDDQHKPMLMRGKLSLYRSMSLPELQDIFKTGAILGKGNIFNGFDRRRYVFFGPAPTSRLLGQGDEIGRMISTKMAAHPVHGKFDALQALLVKSDQAIEEAITWQIRRMNFTREGDGKPPLDETDEIVRRLARQKIDAKLFTARRMLRDKEQKLRDQYRLIQRGLQTKEQESRRSATVTSALIKTHPIGGGLHYSLAHGQSGMGDEDEYGFRSGVITLADIETITLYNGKQPVFSGSPAESKAALKRLLSVKSPQPPVADS